MFDELVEDLIARPGLRWIGHLVYIAKAGKLNLKAECAGTNALSKFFELFTRPLQIGVRGPLFYRRSIPNAVQHEIEMDSFVTLGGDATSIHSHSSHRCSAYPALNESA